MADAPVQGVEFSAEAHPKAITMKRAVLICMFRAKVCEGGHTSMTDDGGHDVSEAGRHKAGGGARFWIVMRTATYCSC